MLWAEIRFELNKKAAVPFVGMAAFFIVFFTNALAIRANKKGGKRTNEAEGF